MSASDYTLLIVESPVIAKIIQNHAHSSVYVLSTGGYCWHPLYKPDTHKLTTRADPKKRKLRRELKKQAHWAGKIIVATDEDPSGDFIAWSVSRFLKSPRIQRGCLQSLDRNGIRNMLNDSVPLEESLLEYRLRNRYLIRQEWIQSSMPLTIQQAGIAAALGSDGFYTNFTDKNDSCYKSTRAVPRKRDEWFQVHLSSASNVYRQQEPLSTFDVIAEYTDNHIRSSYQETENLLQKLFQTVLPFTNEPLISYPRTGVRAFYRETWNLLRDQYLKTGSLNELKPEFLQETASPNFSHESLHPLNTTLSPKKIRGELPEDICRLYALIHQRTMEAISIPVMLPRSYTRNIEPGIHFYPMNETGWPGSIDLKPIITTTELGHSLNRLGVLKPSTFGKNLTQWIDKKWINVQHGIVEPGKAILPHLDSAGIFKEKLKVLRQVSDENDLSPETVRAILTS